MEIIKRKILLENSIDRNYDSKTYGLLTATSFYINVVLNQTIDDMGLFTDSEYIPNINSNTSPLIDYSIRFTGKNVTDYFYYTNNVITATTESRINDVKSYSQTENFKLNFDISNETYINYVGKIINGVDRVTNLTNPITYVFDANKTDSGIGTPNQKNGLVYYDYSGTQNTAKITYVGEGWNQTNISLSALTKEEYLFGIISKPEVENDVFIDRGMTTVSERHFKLSEIKSIGELVRYGNGYFNVTS